ncbi:hypothetical protein [Enterococcus casseliflavus]|uniref:hypothetical protein n=1 Tax=Enterococcus casseliflavus TaxID=37734 RepID=UPI0022E41F5F|nr:hypothetical protein [Enterococcus casseliflavus]
MNVSEEYKITAGTISGATLKSIDIEPSIIVDGKSYTASEFNKAIEMLKQPQLNENQQQVLGWLKEYYKENRPFTTAFGAIRNVASKRWAFIKQNLTEDQQEYVLEAFSRWALEQEE